VPLPPLNKPAFAYQSGFFLAQRDYKQEALFQQRNALLYVRVCAVVSGGASKFITNMQKVAFESSPSQKKLSF
jgi:hypothetical protein